MSDDALSAPVILNRADGSVLTFKKCTPRERLAFRAILRQYRKAWLRQSLDIEGIAGETRIAYYNALDSRRLYESDAIRFLNEMEGQYEVILLSLQLDKPDAAMEDVYAFNLSDEEALTLAAGVLNIPLVGKGGQQQPSPPSGTATGPETPPQSPTSPESPTL